MSEATPGRAAGPRPRRAGALRALAVPLLVAVLGTAAAPGWTTVRVRQGDTLSAIAHRYHTSVARLVRANDLPGNGHVIIAGAVLKVPTAAAQAKIAAKRSAGSRAHRTTARRTTVRTTTVRSTRVVYVRYVVRPGDSLQRIARHYGTPASAIRLRNSLPGDSMVRIGQVLRIPVHRTTAVRTTTRTPSRTPTRRKATSRPLRTTGSNSFAGRTYPSETVRRAAVNRAKLASRSLPSRDRMRAIIASTARKHGVSPSLALAVAYQESGWSPRVVSVAGAIGALQVMPATGEWASGIVGRRLNLLDPYDNATAGVVLLQVLTRTAATTEQAVAGYYQGLASVRSRGMFSDTKQYVASVMALRGRFGA
ncbi:LysM repeat protein [Motilibacter rhizosphaerae]|uniref:LysM repeat protein n=1 Tax=Motilibacter rhizosphaerae TaxID=598652 RepID=A0A4Q7NGC2_9ACTN|nr:LysM peptidoglycan-binding domain-containing protein [Motilibacter rhizosphaerae]RZS82951.1 LysM repeat protein [Motilibacter rhizosphaerae]